MSVFTMMFRKLIARAALVVGLGFAALPVNATPLESRLAKLIGQGDVALAKAELAQSNPSKADVLFFDALVAKSEKNWDRALPLLEQVIILQPNHMNARREMAHVLLLSKRFRLAERNIKALQDFDPVPQMQRAYQIWLSQIQLQKPYGISGRFALMPSTNVNRGTDNTLFGSAFGVQTISSASRTTSGVGLQLGVDGFWRGPIKGGRQNNFNWSVTSTAYKKSQFNSVIGTLQFRHARKIGASALMNLSPYVRYTFREDDADHRDIGILAGVQNKIGPKRTLNTKITYEYRDYLTQDFNSGQFFELNSHITVQPSAGFQYGAGLTLTRATPNAEHGAYRGAQVMVNATRAFSGGLVLGGALKAGVRDYDINYTGLAFPRADDFFGLEVSLQHKQFNVWGFVPKSTCSFVKTTSNVAFFDSKVTECHLGVSKRF